VGNYFFDGIRQMPASNEHTVNFVPNFARRETQSYLKQNYGEKEEIVLEGIQRGEHGLINRLIGRVKSYFSPVDDGIECDSCGEQIEGDETNRMGLINFIMIVLVWLML